MTGSDIGNSEKNARITNYYKEVIFYEKRIYDSGNTDGSWCLSF